MSIEIKFVSKFTINFYIININLFNLHNESRVNIMSYRIRFLTNLHNYRYIRTIKTILHMKNHVFIYLLVFQMLLLPCLFIKWFSSNKFWIEILIISANIIVDASRKILENH